MGIFLTFSFFPGCDNNYYNYDRCSAHCVSVLIYFFLLTTLGVTLKCMYPYKLCAWSRLKLSSKVLDFQELTVLLIL